MSVPCFDPTCPCCSAHTILERQYEDQIEKAREAWNHINYALSWIGHANDVTRESLHKAIECLRTLKGKNNDR